MFIFIAVYLDIEGPWLIAQAESIKVQRNKQKKKHYWCFKEIFSFMQNKVYLVNKMIRA